MDSTASNSIRFPQYLNARTAIRNGFTLIELVAVIVIMGILAAAIGPRFFDLSVFSERGYADELAAAVRYSQKVAASSECPVLFSVTGSGYQSMQRASCTTGSWTVPVVYGDGSAVTGTKPSGVVVATTQFTVAAAGGITGGVDATISVTSHVVTVDGKSGFVSVS